MCSCFDPEEIARLGKRFRKLDLDNNGALSVDEFMSLPELQQNPLVQRVIEIFDQDGNGYVLKGEVKDVMKEMGLGEEDAANIAKNCMEDGDGNSDAKMTLQEFKDFMNKSQ